MMVLLRLNVKGYEIDEHLIDRVTIFVELPEFLHQTFVDTAGYEAR